MKRRERGEVATILTIGTLIVIGVTAVVSSFFVNQRRTTSSQAAETCSEMASHRTGDHPGTVGTDKKDQTDACNPACCEWEGQCPNGQKCDIPNGYCKSGFSCNPDSGQERICVDNQCVWQPCGSNTTPCGERAGCTSHSQCQSGGGSSSTGGGSSSTAPVGGDCFNLSAEVYADQSGSDWKFNAHVKVFSPPEGKDGHIQLWVNGNSKGWNQAWNKGVNNPFDIDPQYTDSPTLSKGQSRSMTYKVKVDECAPLTNEYQISCSYSVNANNQPVIEGGACSCRTGNCGSATPPASPSPKPPSPSPKTGPSSPPKSPKPYPECVDIGTVCKAHVCRTEGGNTDWVCTEDGDWCCPPGKTTSLCTGEVPVRCDSTTGVCKQYGNGGNTQYYFKVGSKYYSGNNCTDITSSIRTYCGCGGAQTNVCVGETSTVCTTYCAGHGGGGNSNVFFDIAGKIYDQKCVLVPGVTKESYCGCTLATDTCAGTNTCTGSCVDPNQQCKVFTDNKCQCVYVQSIPIAGGGGCASGKICGTACCPNANDTCDTTDPNKCVAPFNHQDADYTKSGSLTINITLANVNPGRDINEEVTRFTAQIINDPGGYGYFPCADLRFKRNGNILTATCSNLQRFDPEKHQIKTPVQVDYNGRSGVGIQRLYANEVVFRADEFEKTLPLTFDFGTITKYFTISIDTSCASLFIEQGRVHIIADEQMGGMPYSDERILPGRPWVYSGVVDTVKELRTVQVKEATCESNQGSGYSTIRNKTFGKSGESGNNFIVTIHEGD